MFEKHLRKSGILSKDVGHAPGFYISETLVENGLKNKYCFTLHKTDQFLNANNTQSFLAWFVVKIYRCI